MQLPRTLCQLGPDRSLSCTGLAGSLWAGCLSLPCFSWPWQAQGGWEFG